MLSPPSKKSQENLLEIFRASLKGLRTDSYVLENEKSTIEVIRKILVAKECKFAVVAGLPSRVRAVVVEEALKGFEFRSVEQLRGPDVVNTVAKADVGITWAGYGVAKQGAIMEVVYDDAVKLASSLPFHHIALLSSKSVFGELSEAIKESGRIIASSQAGKKPVISFISGPSKTGDIEMKLLYGVHGPNTLSVLLLNWA